MTFKAKTKNRNPINTVKTLDAIHFDIIENFKKDEVNIPNLKSSYDIITTSIEKLNIKKTQNIDNVTSMNIQKEIWELEDTKNEIKDKIYDIENKITENNYLLQTGCLLKKYYNIDKNKQLEHISKKKKPKTKKTVLDWIEHDKQNGIYYNLKTGKPILNFLNQNENNNSKNKNTDSNINKSEANSNDNINIKKNKYISKNKIYQNYMNILDKDNIKYTSSDEEDLDICDICDREMLLEHNTGILLCPNCGIQEQVLVDSDKPSYKDPPKEITSFCYKRINHLNEFLAQFQAKETTEIPEDIYNEILVEIKKERIENMVDITSDKMRSILRKIRRNDYYEHIPYIINQLNGLPPPVISPEVEEIIRSMFKEIQVPFEKYCPKKRKNFLSYNYVMYKFFELLELDEYLKCFQLLKSRNKLHQQDLIWKNICKHIKWQFIPSL